MALKATIFKANLEVADLDRAYYGTHALTLARHPSETDARMMVRLLAFALHASATLAFGRGLSTDDEPALWDRDATGAIATWIDVGLPDERTLRKASGRAAAVHLYAYGGRAVDLWWERSADTLARIPNLTIRAVGPAALDGLAALAERSMQLQCTVQDGHIWFSNARSTVPFTLDPIAGPDQ
jgi:uncharacterized protein YaeQ